MVNQVFPLGGKAERYLPRIKPAPVPAVYYRSVLEWLQALDFEQGRESLSKLYWRYSHDRRIKCKASWNEFIQVANGRRC